MNSHESEHTPFEKETLIQFRKILSDVLKPGETDQVLLKFLRAKNFNLRKSEELYRVDRRSKKIFFHEELQKFWQIPEVLEKYTFANDLGIAKDGTPIRYMAMGRGDLKGLYLSLDVYDIGKYCLAVIESDLKRCKEQSYKLGRDINEVTYIVDLKCLSLRQVWFSGVYEMAIDLFRLIQDHYPEIWKNVLIVNAPFYFHSLFNFFKPVFRFNFLEKIRVASTDQTPSLLLTYIDDNVLPEFLGGKRVDSTGDPMCTEFIKFGGYVPEKYYLSNRLPLLPTDPGVEEHWLPSKNCLNAFAVVHKANSLLHVEFRSEGGSLPAMLLYRKFESDPNEYIDLPDRYEYLDPKNKKHNVIQCGPYIHLHTHVSPINNYAYAPWPGIYIFKIDNSYNWLTGRKCIYRIRVEPPETTEDINNKF